MTYEDWSPIARLAVTHNLVVISDEMYAELTYGRTHTSIASRLGCGSAPSSSADFPKPLP